MFKRLQKYWDRAKVIREVGSFDQQGLITAVEEGKIASLQIMIQEGIDVNSTSIRGVPALSRAINKGNLPVIRILFAAGANIDQQDKLGRTPLMHAIDEGNKHVFSFILEQAPDLEITNLAGETALIRATQDGNTTLVRKLIQAGAELDVINSKGQTPLMIAAEHLRTGIVRSLIEAGADVSVRDKQGHTVMDNNHLSPRIAKLLKRATAQHKKEFPAAHRSESRLFYPEDQPALIDWLVGGLRHQLPRVTALVSGMLDGAMQALNGNETLEELNQKGKEIVNQLNLKENIGELKKISPLLTSNFPKPHTNGQNGHHVQNGNGQHPQNGHAHPEQETESFSHIPPQKLDLALLEAAEKGAFRSIALLIEAGADVDVYDQHGNTPLHLAIEYPDIVSLLLSLEANPEIKNRKEKTPLDLAMEKEISQSAELLSAAAQKETEPSDPP